MRSLLGQSYKEKVTEIDLLAFGCDAFRIADSIPFVRMGFPRWLGVLMRDALGEADVSAYGFRFGRLATRLVWLAHSGGRV